MIAASTTNLQGFLAAVEQYPEVARRAASLAVNDAAEWGANLARRKMASQVRLPADVLTGARFGIVQRASQVSIEAIVRASPNPLGLSRFVTGSKEPRSRNPATAIKPGSAPFVWKRGFLMPTPNGADGVALAVRTNGPLRSSRAARQIAKNLYILSGPSPNQIFMTVAKDILPALQTRLDGEFARQYERLLRG